MGRPTKEQRILEASQVPGIMPLDYMISVIRDETATQTRRDKMAIAAAPYCHPRLVAPEVRPPGKKEQQAEKSEVAAIGTPWENFEIEIRPS